MTNTSFNSIVIEETGCVVHGDSLYYLQKFSIPLVSQTILKQSLFEKVIHNIILKTIFYFQNNIILLPEGTLHLFLSEYHVNDVLDNNTSVFHNSTVHKVKFEIS